MASTEQLDELEKLCFDAAWAVHRSTTSRLLAVMWDGSERATEFNERNAADTSTAHDTLCALSRALDSLGYREQA